MRFCFRVVTALAFLGLASSPLSARAGLIIGNLDQPPDTSGDYAYVTGNSSYAQEFIIGAGATVTTVSASLGYYDPGVSNSGGVGDFTVTAALYTDTGGSGPGTALPVSYSQVQASIPTSGFATISFTNPTGAALTGGTAYWLVLSGNFSNTNGAGDTGSVIWQYTDSTALTPGSVPNSSLPNYATNYPGGWGASGNINPGAPFMLELDGTIVPEPSSLLLGCVGLTAALYFGRNFRSRSRGRNLLSN